MPKKDIHRALPFQNEELVNYAEHSIVIRTIISKPTGSISVASFAEGESIKGKISPFNTLIQVIEGEAEITIGVEAYIIKEGQSIIVQANLRSILKANTQFKILTTIINSAYESVSR